MHFSIEHIATSQVHCKTDGEKRTNFRIITYSFYNGEITAGDGDSLHEFQSVKRNALQTVVFGESDLSFNQLRP